jgi:hypothetical protein
VGSKLPIRCSFRKGGEGDEDRAILVGGGGRNVNLLVGDGQATAAAMVGLLFFPTLSMLMGL